MKKIKWPKEYFLVVENLFHEVGKPFSNLLDIKKFLDNKIPVNYVHCNQTILHLACGKIEGKNRQELIDLILKYKPDVNIRNQRGLSVLQCACRNKNVNAKIIKQLLDAGAHVNDVDNHGRTAIFWACDHLLLDTLHLLCERGVDWDHQDENGESALFWAAEKQKMDLVKHLLALKAQLFVSKKKQSCIDFLDTNNKRHFFNHIDAITDRREFLLYVKDRKKKLNNANKRKLNKVTSLKKFRTEVYGSFSFWITMKEEVKYIRRRMIAYNKKRFQYNDNIRDTRLDIYKIHVLTSKLKQEIYFKSNVKKRIEDYCFELFDKLYKERDTFYKRLLPTHVVNFAKCNPVGKAGYFGSVQYININWDSCHNNYPIFPLAIKKVESRMLTNLNVKKHFKIVSLIDNKNLIRNFGLIIKSKQEQYIISEFHDRTLKNYIEEGDKATILEDIKVISNICSGLKYLYSKNMHHGNLKINNVILTNNEDKCKLSDFFYVKKHEDKKFNSNFVFKAPEQYDKNIYESNLKIDIYAFGILMYCILFKKKEEDLYHRLNKGAKDNLVKFLHTEKIRPLLQEFPMELGLELEIQYKNSSKQFFDKIVDEVNRGKKKFKEILKDFGNDLTSFFFLKEKKLLKKEVESFQEWMKKNFKKKKGLFKKKSVNENVVNDFKQFWDKEFDSYFTEHLLPHFRNAYMKEISNLHKINKAAIKNFKILIQKLIKNPSKSILEYMEVLWKDVLYCKEFLKKITKKELIGLMKKCWSHNPKDRPKSFDEIYSNIEKIFSGQVDTIKHSYRPEEIKQLIIAQKKEKLNVIQGFKELKEKEIKNYIQLDYKEEEIIAIKEEKKARERNLKKVNDEIEKLMKSKGVLEGEIKIVNKNLADTTKVRNNLLNERVKLTLKRQKLCDKELIVKQKLRTLEEREKMTKMVKSVKSNKKAPPKKPSRTGAPKAPPKKVPPKGKRK